MSWIRYNECFIQYLWKAIEYYCTTIYESRWNISLKTMNDQEKISTDLQRVNLAVNKYQTKRKERVLRVLQIVLIHVQGG